MAKWRIDYSDDTGAGDCDPGEYDTFAAAEDEAKNALQSGDMPWAVKARLFPVDDDGEPLDEPASVTVTAPKS